MIRHLAFLAARLSAAAVFLLTWAYGVTTYSPFAFDMFVKPRLFPWLADFVVAHYFWYWFAFLLSSGTLIPDLRALNFGLPRARAAWFAAAGYVAVFGAVGVYLVASPYLSTLGSGSRSVLVVPGALLPLVWLAMIDHLVVRVPAGGDGAARGTGQRRLLVACVGSGVFVWAAHLLRPFVWQHTAAGMLPSLMTAAWALGLDLTVFLLLYCVLGLVTALAATCRDPDAWEYGLTVAVMAAGASEFMRRIVLPPLSFDRVDAAAISLGIGIALALMWSGLRLRGAARSGRSGTGLSLLLAPRAVGWMTAFLLSSAIAATSLVVVSSVEQLDWDFILQKLVAVAEAALVFGLFLGASRRVGGGRWSMRAMVLAPLAVVAALHLLPPASAAMMAFTGDGRLDPQEVIDRSMSGDLFARFAAGQFIEQPRPDVGYYQRVLASESGQSALKPAAPGKTFAPDPASFATPRPDVFVFVIDSLRRDYLSPYNPAVTFTPALDAWARENFVFRNAFVRYGGTWLSMPSIWTGSVLTRGWAGVFDRLNAIEPLIRTGDYDFAINDHTVAQLLGKETRRTFLNPYVPSVQTDLCQNLTSLEAHIDAGGGQRPVFAYLAPMNVHILNTRVGAADAEGRYAGFHPPYAASLERLDGCFGDFVSYLKQKGRYDNSVIVLSSDHGDSLGEDGNWGHQFFLFPDVVRVPLIVQLPSAQKSSLTTDLARVTFLTDIAPTLLSLVGQQVRDLGPLFGAPLFVPPDHAPVARRRDSFLVMSSYGSTYGMLRRNGRFLYVSDLLNWREYAYTLFREPFGERVRPSDGLRRVNQALINDRVEEVDELYRAR